jgi:hypothetical protein
LFVVFRLLLQQIVMLEGKSFSWAWFIFEGCKLCELVSYVSMWVSYSWINFFLLL